MLNQFAVALVDCGLAGMIARRVVDREPASIPARSHASGWSGADRRRSPIRFMWLRAIKTRADRG
jgi:hypothetical protein